MAKLFITILFSIYILSCSPVKAQNTIDTLVATVSDSITATNNGTANTSLLLSQKILNTHPYFNFRDKGIYPPYTLKAKQPGKEIYFYVLIAILLLFAIFKSSFDKYFSDITNLFFRRSLKQRQLRQQVIQNPLSSLMFNILFIIVGGFYATLYITNINQKPPIVFWQLLLYSIALIAIIYIGKYFVLKFLGWVFGINKLTDNYIFLIFLVNKIIGIVLLPFIVIIALAGIELKTIAWTISWVVLAAFYIYRYITAIGLIKKESNIGMFYFLLYAAAFEILPTIAIYKGIYQFLNY